MAFLGFSLHLTLFGPLSSPLEFLWDFYGLDILQVHSKGIKKSLGLSCSLCRWLCSWDEGSWSCSSVERHGSIVRNPWLSPCSSLSFAFLTLQSQATSMSNRMAIAPVGLKTAR